ncbi:hypothetical protein RIF29_28819 [Crotalaria pallida]|uniref:Uncharacterized protein n=1 Tax=Crotalaria pallida TaxID=3830 RepID=A0AAN9EFJ6_CROPI
MGQQQQLNYPDSVDSSPRSRNTDSWDKLFPPASTIKLRLMCSYGGHIVPRPHDKSLYYVGGDTRIVVVDRTTSLADLSTRLSLPPPSGRISVGHQQICEHDGEVGVVMVASYPIVSETVFGGLRCLNCSY